MCGVGIWYLILQRTQIFFFPCKDDGNCIGKQDNSPSFKHHHPCEGEKWTSRRRIIPEIDIFCSENSNNRQRAAYIWSEWYYRRKERRFRQAGRRAGGIPVNRDDCWFMVVCGGSGKGKGTNRLKNVDRFSWYLLFGFAGRRCTDNNWMLCHSIPGRPRRNTVCRFGSFVVLFTRVQYSVNLLMRAGVANSVYVWRELVVECLVEFFALSKMFGDLWCITKGWFYLFPSSCGMYQKILLNCEKKFRLCK